NGNRVAQMEAEVARLRADQDRRLRALETAPAATESDAPPGDQPDGTPSAPPPPRPKIEKAETKPASTPATAIDGDPAEVAYDEGYQLWTAGQNDAAAHELQPV